MGVSTATMYRWARDGRGPATVSISPNVSAIRNSELLDWLADPAGWAARHSKPLEQRAV